MQKTITRRGRATARGTTLIEVLIVVAIMSLLAAGVTMAVLPQWTQSQIRATEMNARSIRTSVQAWQGMHGSECPSVAQLLADKIVDQASKTEDAWGKPFKIACAGDAVTVLSSGPDKRDSTPDDIIVPKDTKLGGAL